MKILITGGAGFIGANIASAYLKNGDNVTIYDNFYRPGVKSNVDWLQKEYPNHPLTIQESSILDVDQLKKSLKNQDVVFHMAGQTAVTTSVKNPEIDFEINARGTFNVLESVRQISPEAIVLTASTNKVYGNLSRLKIHEQVMRYQVTGKSSVDETEPLDFYSPYGCSKGTADQYTHDYYRIYGIKTIVFRQSCIYGTHQLGVEDQGWLAHFAASFIQDKPLSLFGSGKQVRDALYIDDLVSAYQIAVQKIDKTKGQIYNIGGGEDKTISLLELIVLLEKISGKKIPVEYKPERPGDQKIYISDVSKAQADFGWKPETSVEQGVTKLYKWLESVL